MAEHMNAKTRDTHFRKEYACGGRDAPDRKFRPEPEKRNWDREARRDATHSKD